MPVLPIAVSLPDDSVCDSWSTAGVFVLTGERVRTTVKRSMKEPGRASVPRPSAESMTSADLLQYHAQTLLDTNTYPADKKQRCRTKTALGNNAVLQSLVKDPDEVIRESIIDWAEKRQLSGYVAHVAAVHFDLRVVVARRVIKELWLNITKESLQNWKEVHARFGWPKLGASADASITADSLEMVGGLFTWHTLLGRRSGLISRLVAAGCSINNIAELAVQDSELQREWTCFVTWINSVGDELGFECRAICMELCEVQSATSKVHLHVYFARDPRKWRSPEWGPVTVPRKSLRYMNFEPHIRKANVRNAANPSKQLFGGIWYCLAPKIGSIFRHSKHQLFKDSIAAVLPVLARMQCSVHGGVVSITFFFFTST